MQQVTSINVENLPKIGYKKSDQERNEEFRKNESYIYENTPLTDIKVGADKLSNDLVTYFPKALSGSKNSDFYEYLSLGIVPYIIGSATMIGLYCAANHKYGAGDKTAANALAKRMGMGVILYGIGKWAHQKLARTGVYGSTGINLNWRYNKKVNELPEPGEEKGHTRLQKPGVFDSVAFFRSDLIEKYSEMEHQDAYYYWDKILKKAGFKEKQNDPKQLASEKIRGVKSRTTALESMGKYIVAATGVAYGFQKAFGDMKLKNPKSIVKAFKDAAKQLWQGNPRNFATKHFGKALVIASVVSTLLSWIIPSAAFKHNPETMKSRIDANKESEVC